MKTLQQWLTSERPPRDFYELLGKKRFDPAVDELQRALQAANRELFPYQNHQDTKIADRATYLLWELGRAADVLANPEKIKKYHGRLLRTIREDFAKSHGDDRQAWQTNLLQAWLEQQDVHPKRSAVLAQALALDHAKIDPQARATTHDLDPLDEESEYEIIPEEDKALPTLNCRWCGSELPPRAIFCRQCGFDLGLGRRRRCSSTPQRAKHLTRTLRNLQEFVPVMERRLQVLILGVVLALCLSPFLIYKAHQAWRIRELMEQLEAGTRVAADRPNLHVRTLRHMVVVVPQGDAKSLEALSLYLASNQNPEMLDQASRDALGTLAELEQAELRGLAEIGPAAVSALTKLLRHVDPRVRANAARALTKIGPPAVPALADTLALLRESRDPNQDEAIINGVRDQFSQSKRFPKPPDDEQLVSLLMAMGDARYKAFERLERFEDFKIQGTIVLARDDGTPKVIQTDAPDLRNNPADWASPAPAESG